MRLAIAAYMRGYHLHPRGEIGSDFLFSAAFASYRFQDYDGASRKFEKLRRRFPGSILSVDARWHLAWIRYLKGDYKGAYADLHDMVSHPRWFWRVRGGFSFTKFRYWMAMCQYRLGHIGRASDELAKLSNDPLDGYYSIAARDRLLEINQTNNRSLASVTDQQKSKVVGGSSKTPQKTPPLPSVQADATQTSDSAEGTSLQAQAEPDTNVGSSAESRRWCGIIE